MLTVDHAELDLTRQRKVEDWLGAVKPQVIFFCAAKVGGILATRPNRYHSSMTISPWLRT